MLEYTQGLLDGGLRIGDTRIAGGTDTGVMVTGHRWKIAAGADPTGDGSEWMWKIIRRTPEFTPTWIFDGPAVDVRPDATDKAKFQQCLVDARQIARNFRVSFGAGMLQALDGSNLYNAVAAAQGVTLWEEIEEWVHSVELFTAYSAEC